jgi:D-alanyl-D-alanine carboxypeptidase
LGTFLERLADRAVALLTQVELVEKVLDEDPEFPAGEGFAYGDTNYVIAGLVIERATGASAFDGIEARLLEPLGLGSITPTRTRRITGLAAGYQLPVNPFLLPPKIAEDGVLRVHPMIESTAGGFATTPSDMVRWAKALFEERALPGPYLDALVGHPVQTGDGRRYGLGVYIEDTPLGVRWGHGGFFPGYRSALLYLPESGVAVCVQLNRDFLVDIDAIALEIARRVTSATPP